MVIRIGKKEENGDKRLSLFICVYILSSSFNILIKTIFRIPENQWGLISRLFGFVIILSLLIAFSVLVSRKHKTLILSELLFLTLYGLSFIMGYADRSLLYDTAFWTLFVCIPIGVAGIAIKNQRILFTYLRGAAYIEFPFLVLGLLQMRNIGTYSMSISYSLVLPILFLINDYLDKKKWTSLLLAVFSSVAILIFGSRGPLVCILSYVTFKLFITNRNAHAGIRYMLIKLFAVSLIVLVVFYWNNILRWLQSFAGTHQLNTYVLRRIISGQILTSDARSDFRSYYMDLAKEKPLFGYGLMGGWIAPGAGPHNMLIEFILAFGYFIGGLLCIGTIYILAKTIISKNTNELILVLACVNIPLYLVSGDWLESPLFFLFVFLALHERRRKCDPAYDQEFYNISTGDNYVLHNWMAE